MRINRQEFLKTLQCLSTAVAHRDLNPIFKQVAFHDGLGYSFNGECGLIASVPKDLRLMTTAKELMACLSKYTEDEIELVCDDSIVTVCQGRSKTRLQCSDPNLFPQIFPKGYMPFTESEQITEVVKKALSLIDSDAPLSQIGIKKDYVYAVDGRRVCRFKLDKPASEHAVTLSTSAASAFAAQGVPIKVFATDSQLVGHFKHALFIATFVASRVPYPMIDRLANVEPIADNIKMLPETFAGALERIRMFCEKHEGAVLESTGNDLILSARKSDVGAFEEAFDWSFRPFRIGINPHHINAALSFSNIVDWSSVLSDDPRVIRFVLPGSDHFVSLMEL